MKPLLTYAAPVWFPNASRSSIQPLQAIQNAALRIASGALLMTAQDHLHGEARLLPVDRELSMLCGQFLLGALRHGHPSSAVASADPGPRSIRSTLRSKFLPSVQPYLQNGATPDNSYRSALRSIHNGAVADAISSAAPNRVLDRAPPPVDGEEIHLPRHYRTSLAQLRSGFSSSLGDYLARVGRVQSPLCPECGGAEHTVRHLFDCPAHPTRLCTVDLWERPRRVAHFMSSLPAFAHLPPLPPPPPEPPP